MTNERSDRHSCGARTTRVSVPHSPVRISRPSARHAMRPRGHRQRTTRATRATTRRIVLRSSPERIVQYATQQATRRSSLRAQSSRRSATPASPSTLRTIRTAWPAIRPVHASSIGSRAVAPTTAPHVTTTHTQASSRAARSRAQAAGSAMRTSASRRRHSRPSCTQVHGCPSMAHMLLCPARPAIPTRTPRADSMR